MQDFTENVNCPDEPMLTCDNYNIDNTLNDKLKFLTEDLVTNMNNVSIKTVKTHFNDYYLINYNYILIIIK